MSWNPKRDYSGMGYGVFQKKEKKMKEDRWTKEANFFLEKCEPNSDFAVGFRLGYIKGCKKRQKEIEELRKGVEGYLLLNLWWQQRAKL